MGFIAKLKETLLSVFPIIALVFILILIKIPIAMPIIINFVVGSLLLILGLSIFLQGVEISIIPVGSLTGSTLTNSKNVLLLLTVSFITGFIITIAEPDVQVLATQFTNVSPSINKVAFILCIAGGVGLFVMAGLFRIICKIPLIYILWISYVIIFVLAFLVNDKYLGISFDAGGATTGPMTVPFIMALGIGVSSSTREKNTFGLTGIASIGPILSVLIFSLLSKNNTNNIIQETQLTYTGLSTFVTLLPQVVCEVIFSLLPLVFLFIIFLLFLLKMPPIQMIKITVGIVYSLVGLVLFLLGVKGGFINMANTLGKQISFMAQGSTGGIILLIIVGLLLGAFTVCAEPAVYVLTQQVEEASGGIIKRKLLLICLAIGVSLAVALSLLKNIYDFNLYVILLVGYSIALVLSIICPPLFVGIAFDSGGVVSGPMTSTFILSFILGAAGQTKNAFGLIALVALSPLITLQIFGLLYKINIGKNNNV